MASTMTIERATEFGSAWNSGDPDLVTSFFAENGTYYASVGPEHMGGTFTGKARIREGVRIFFDRFPSGRFENLRVTVSGKLGTFEWDFVTRDASGKESRVAGCDLLEFEGDRVKTKNAFRKVRVFEDVTASKA